MKIRDKAIQWMKDNMRVVDMFEEFAGQLVERNRSFGINLLRERIRWEFVYQHSGDYKFPNDYSPYVARYLLWKHPEWSGNMRCKRAKDEGDGIILITEEELGIVTVST